MPRPELPRRKEVASPAAAPASGRRGSNTAERAGPRAPQCLILGARTLALLRGLPTPSCREVRDVALPVLQHRIIPNYNASGDGIDAQKIVERLLTQVKEASYK